MDELRDKFAEFKERMFEYSTEQKRAIAVICIAGVSISAFLFFASRGEAVEAPPVKVIQEAPAKMLLIHVAGEVKRPGVYPVVYGSRVIDAIAAAGGAKKGIDLSQLNLARRLVDGEQIYLGRNVEDGVEIRRNSAGRTSSKTSFSGVVYINRATAAQFDSLDGIGPVIAKRIIEYRNTNGPFVDVTDIQKVTGIGAKTFAKIQNRLSL